MKCTHQKFLANVEVGRMEDSGRFMADIRIICDECKEPFRFLGLPAGLDMNGASVSADGTQARMAIGTAETVASIIDGADLPKWPKFRADPLKQKQSEGWIVVAETVLDLL